jgi:hypothetical protein
MLKPTEGEQPPERPILELFEDAVDDGKAYARAEIDLAKAIAIAKARALVLPSALIGAALVFALAAVTALAVGVVLALVKFIGPLAAGVIGLLVFAAIAGGLFWLGVSKLQDIF